MKRTTIIFEKQKRKHDQLSSHHEKLSLSSSLSKQHRTTRRRITSHLTIFITFSVLILISIHSYLLITVLQKNQQPHPPPNENTQQLRRPPSPSSLLHLAQQQTLTPLRHPLDYTSYIIRINTYRRNPQLLLSLNHHSTCPGVHRIDVIWCDDANDPPPEILHHKSGKVVVERHGINSLNERFVRMDKKETDPVGVLSLDDDILRPCEALDDGFFRWTRSSHKMVGFDARRHISGDDDKTTWSYGYLSRTEKSNRYSLVLTRTSFLHGDYLDWYATYLPREIYDTVERNFECEDIAMSFFISRLTGGDPPLLADYWAVKSRIKLYVEKKISGGENHKSLRDDCVNDFAAVLGLKTELRLAKLYLESGFRYGDQPEGVLPLYEGEMVTERHGQLVELLSSWREKRPKRSFDDIMNEARREALESGFIEKTPQWEKRWKKR